MNPLFSLRPFQGLSIRVGDDEIAALQKKFDTQINESQTNQQYALGGFVGLAAIGGFAAYMLGDQSSEEESDYEYYASNPLDFSLNPFNAFTLQPGLTLNISYALDR